MKGRVGTKNYDTDKAELIDTLPDGIQVYRKKGRSTEFYLYNSQGRTAKEKFFDLPHEQAIKYLPENNKSKKKYGREISLSEYDAERIRQLAYKNGMQVTRFILMLVDKYESDLSED